MYIDTGLGRFRFPKPPKFVRKYDPTMMLHRLNMKIIKGVTGKKKSPASGAPNAVDESSDKFSPQSAQAPNAQQLTSGGLPTVVASSDDNAPSGGSGDTASDNSQATPAKRPVPPIMLWAGLGIAAWFLLKKGR